MKICVSAGILLALSLFFLPALAREETLAPATDSGTATGAVELRVPDGFIPAPNTGHDPYTKTGWANEIVHKKTGIEMVFIPAGEFMMGLGAGGRDVTPTHRVRITKPFYLGKYEVTTGQWQAVMGTDLWNFKGRERLGAVVEGYVKRSDQAPIAWVSWNSCQEFLRKAGDGLRLPTEAEWEYACKAGSTTKYSFGNDASELGRYAWHGQKEGVYAIPVGRKLPNAWGLYDMHGNVCEWCQDWYDEKYYSKSPGNDPMGPGSGTDRVNRGGCWASNPAKCRSADRARYGPSTGSGYTGFRVCLGLP
jgi:formylglycine-generating enzyme required for sulfatase activity